MLVVLPVVGRHLYFLGAVEFDMVFLLLDIMGHWDVGNVVKQGAQSNQHSLRGRNLDVRSMRALGALAVLLQAVEEERRDVAGADRMGAARVIGRLVDEVNESELGRSK